MVISRKDLDDEDLSPKEEQAYLELKRRVGCLMESHLKDDANYYIRFLRARDFKVDAAETMLRNHIAWRVANQIDSILTSFVPGEVIEKYLPLTSLGTDKDNAPVNFMEFGNMDVKGLLKSSKVSACIKAMVQHYEKDILLMQKISETQEVAVQQWIYIFDFENFSFAKATHKQSLEAIMQFFTTYEANYPERLKTAYFINTSIYFNLIFAVMKPILSANTLKKVVVFGKSGWREELQRIMHLDVLPAFLGGQRTDPDGCHDCNTIIKRGHLVPSHFYLTRSSNSKSRLKGEVGVRHLSVGRGSKSSIEVAVFTEGASLEWEFETENHDIRFGLFYKTQKNSLETELVPRQRIDTYFASEAGMFKCKKAGIYTLMFDNSYSWLRAKDVYCKVAVVNNQKIHPEL